MQTPNRKSKGGHFQCEYIRARSGAIKDVQSFIVLLETLMLVWDELSDFDYLLSAVAAGSLIVKKIFMSICDSGDATKLPGTPVYWCADHCVHR